MDVADEVDDELVVLVGGFRLKRGGGRRDLGGYSALVGIEVRVHEPGCLRGVSCLVDLGDLGTYVIPDRRNDAEFIRTIPIYIQPAAPRRTIIGIYVMQMRRVPSVFGVAIGVRPGGDGAEVAWRRRVIEDTLHI